TITRDGRLLLHAQGGKRGLDRDVEWPLHGDIRFYTSIRDSGESVWIEYVARFTHSRVEWIQPKEEVPPPPEIPPLEWDWKPMTELLENLRSKAEPQGLETGAAAAQGPEGSLLLSLRRERHELEALLKQCSDHWGYEDPIYRFYHQSFKVYGLQQQTRSIVEKLQALAPGLPLNPWFVQIVESGTGKEFKHEDNARWTEVTRPILEAFFHARFFLEMAVRYADLQAPPQPLPSGYAALLYLFGLR
ncbi:MAG: hypothetical protein ACJ759_03220, partial [Thermoanaerobaculia bacterium]